MILLMLTTFKIQTQDFYVDLGGFQSITSIEDMKFQLQDGHVGVGVDVDVDVDLGCDGLQEHGVVLLSLSLVARVVAGK